MGVLGPTKLLVAGDVHVSGRLWEPEREVAAGSWSENRKVGLGIAALSSSTRSFYTLSWNTEAPYISALTSAERRHLRPSFRKLFRT